MLTFLLGNWKIIAYAVAIAAFVGFVSYEKHSYDERRRQEGAAPYVAAIESQKREAKLLLESEIAKNKIIEQDWIDYARSADDEYAKKIAAIRASANGLRLTDPGRREGGGCPSPGKGDTTTPQNPAASGQLSGEASAFLRGEAIRADEVATWAKSCHAYVNRKSMKSQVKELP